MAGESIHHCVGAAADENDDEDDDIDNDEEDDKEEEEDDEDVELQEIVMIYVRIRLDMKKYGRLLKPIFGGDFFIDDPAFNCTMVNLRASTTLRIMSNKLLILSLTSIVLGMNSETPFFIRSESPLDVNNITEYNPLNLIKLLIFSE